MTTAAQNPADRLSQALEVRFGERVELPAELPGVATLAGIADHRSIRKFDGRPVSPDLLRLLLACALSAPSKSDLQQADIVHVADRAKVQAIADLLPSVKWIADAPVFLVFCGNNRRMRQMGEWRNVPFANDHLDHFMNAAVDAGIVMTTFIHAAEAAGLGTCPISVVRNKPREISEILGLPDWVFPVAGMVAGYPGEKRNISPRLPLAVTLHTDRFGESQVREHIDAYDQRRHAMQPYRKQRHTSLFGEAPFYGWSEDKVRQYGVPERKDFGAFIRDKKFGLT